MKQVITMSVDLRIELACGDINKLDIKAVNDMLGYNAFNENGEPTQEAFEREKALYTQDIKNDIEEMLECDVDRVYNFNMKFERENK